MEKTTRYGTIKISDNAFEKLIKDALLQTKGAESLAMEIRPIIIKEDEERITLEFHVVHKFGTSMRHSAKTVMDYIEKNLKSIKLSKNVTIRMMIVAVKARKTVKRDLEFARIVRLR